MTKAFHTHTTLFSYFLLLILLMTGCADPEKDSRTEHEKGPTERTSTENKEATKKNGQVVKYHENGEVKMSGRKENGVREGVWSAWYPSGKQWSETTFEDGKRNGPTRTWYQNGNLRYKGFYKDDRPVGVWHFYNKKGELAEKKDYGQNSSKKQP